MPRPMPSPYDMRYQHRCTAEELLQIAADAGIVFWDARCSVAVKFRPDPNSPGWLHGWAEVCKQVAWNGVSPVRLEEFCPPVHFHGFEEVPDHACTFTMGVYLAGSGMVAMMGAEQLRACVDAGHIQPAHALRGPLRVLPSQFTNW